VAVVGTHDMTVAAVRPGWRGRPSGDDETAGAGDFSNESSQQPVEILRCRRRSCQSAIPLTGAGSSGKGPKTRRGTVHRRIPQSANCQIPRRRGGRRDNGGKVGIKDQ